MNRLEKEKSARYRELYRQFRKQYPPPKIERKDPEFEQKTDDYVDMITEKVRQQMVKEGFYKS